jgi:hypothetical protein
VVCFDGRKLYSWWFALPLINQALTVGPLTPAEKAVLAVVDRHYDYIWSDSLDDLCEVARWATYPELKNCPELCSQDSEITGQLLKKRVAAGLTINSKVFCLSGGGKHPPEVETYTLRTIATALDRLARTKRIWAFELHGRRHYGAKSAKAGVIRTYEDLPKEQRDEARFNPEFTFPDNNLAT